VLPPDGGTEVPVDALTKIVFSEDVVAISLSDIEIEGATGVSAVFDEATDSITIAHDPFVPSTQYTVTLPPDTVEDRAGNTNDEIVWSFVTADVNNPPDAGPDALATDENTALVGENVFVDHGDGPDWDFDGQIISVTEVGGSTDTVGTPVPGTDGGLFTISEDGSLVFDPHADFEDLGAGESRETTVSYAISDTDGGRDETTVAVTVAGVNDAPSISGAEIVLDDTSESFSAFGLGWTDPEGDAENYRFEWRRNGATIPGETGPTLDVDSLAPGDAVSCRVTPWDGYDEGPPVAAESATVPLWVCHIEVAGADADSLQFGMLTDATNGLDRYDTTRTLPPAGAAAVYLLQDGRSDIALLRDCRSVQAETEWMLVVQPGTEDVNLSWVVPGEFPQDRHLSLYEIDAATATAIAFSDINMRRTLLLKGADGNGESRLYLIRYAADLSFHLGFQPTWNLFSLPIQPDSNLVEDVLNGTGTTSVWGWDGSRYQPYEAMDVFAGYWRYADTATVIGTAGLPVANPSVQLIPGWNLVGPLETIPVPDDPALASPAWFWNAAQQHYEEVEDGEPLLPGRAYWLFATDACLINLSSGSEAKRDGNPASW